MTGETIERLTAGQKRARIGSGGAVATHFHRAAHDDVSVVVVRA